MHVYYLSVYLFLFIKKNTCIRLIAENNYSLMKLYHFLASNLYYTTSNNLFSEYNDSIMYFIFYILVITIKI